MQEPFHKDLLVNLYIISGLSAIVGAILFLPITKRDKLERKTPEIVKLDSIYNAKRDSLNNWYQVQLDSLNRDYETRKNLENLAKESLQ